MSPNEVSTVSTISVYYVSGLYKLRAELKGELILIKGVLGVTVTGVVAVLIRLLFMRI